MADKIKQRKRKRSSYKRKRFGKQMILHLLIIILFMLLGLCYVVFHLVTYQIKDAEGYKKKVLSQQKYSSSVINYRRGDILDRKGSFLATSTKIYNLVLEPKNIIKSDDYKISKEETYKDITINALYKYFDFKQGEVEEILKKESNSYYYIAKKKLTYNDVSAYMDFRKTKTGKKIIGVVLEESYERTYPNNNTACQLIGYTSSGNVGNWGLEQQYNELLNGTNGRTYSYMNDDGSVDTEVHDATDGDTIVSTLDLNVQNIVDKQVKRFNDKIGAKNVSVLVMDPNNAEVLAMSNSKTYNLNAPYDESALTQLYTQEEIATMSKKDKLEGLSKIWRNFIVSDTYEPGSTFKPFTVCAALDEGVIHDGDKYFCAGRMKVADRTIRCHSASIGGDGWLDVEHSIAKSCNVALIQINQALGPKRFTKYEKVFGFGQYTNIDLPGETSAEGLIYSSADSIGKAEMATSSFGQGFNCTMIQLATAFSSLINGGNYYEPHVVKEIQNANGGTIQTIEKKLVKKTISKSTSKLMKRYLRTTVKEGTGTACQIPGYEIGGKTGTAEKLPRDNHKYLISFIGFAPYDNPQVVVYVTIDEINLSPQDQTSYAVKLARGIFKQILPYLGVEQSGDTNKSNLSQEAKEADKEEKQSAKEEKKQQQSETTQQPQSDTTQEATQTQPEATTQNVQ